MWRHGRKILVLKTEVLWVRIFSETIIVSCTYMVIVSCIYTVVLLVESWTSRSVKSGSDPRGTPNADGSGVRKGGVRRAKSNTEVVFEWGARGGMSMDARIRLRVDKHAGGP